MRTGLSQVLADILTLFQGGKLRVGRVSIAHPARFWQIRRHRWAAAAHHIITCTSRFRKYGNTGYEVFTWHL